MTNDFVRVRMPVCKCLSCGHTFDCATNVQGAPGPSPGDVTFCMRCAHIMFFDEGLTVREPDAEEKVRLDADPRISKLRRVLLENIARIKRVH